MILYIIVFVFVLFFYIHIYHHLQKSNELELYNIDYTTKGKLDEICRIRQPVMFEMDIPLIDKTLEEITDMYGNFDVKLIRKENDIEQLYDLEVIHNTPIEMTLQETIELFRKDISNNGIYRSELNQEFLEDTGLLKQIKRHDAPLRPLFITKCDYDLLLGNKNTTTQLKYHHYYRYYLYVASGSITIKLIPPKYSKYLYSQNNYTQFLFYSPINAWKVQPIFERRFSKVNMLEIKLKKGEILYIPPYWWYSIRYDEISCVCKCTYMTGMNMVSIAPQLLICLLQRSNVKHKFIKTKNDMNIRYIDRHIQQPK
jgi:hypothetical protein